jgi:hypothetical protein
VAVRLDPTDIEAIAQRTVELLAEQRHLVRYVDAEQLAGRLGVDRRWVYSHAAQLGAIRLGGGHGRLRFDVARVTQLLAVERRDPIPATGVRPRRHKRGGEGRRFDLLPYES